MGVATEGEWVFEPHDDMDFAHAEQLRAQWYAVVDEWEPDRVVVDLRDVGVIDGWGLSVIAGLTERQRTHAGFVAVRNVSALVARVMSGSGLASALQILPGTSQVSPS